MNGLIMAQTTPLLQMGILGRGSILVNLSGRGDKDLDFVSENYGFGD
jgi:tryptophan synthase beta subunit